MSLRAAFVIPGDLSLPTGGYGYDRQVLNHAAAAGLDLIHCPIPGGYPFPDAAALADTARTIAALPAGCPLLIDGLAYGAMPAEMIRAFARPVVELCHHPLAVEPGLEASAAARLAASERTAMALARAIIVTGQDTARLVARDFAVAEEKITVALPGTERAQRARGSGSSTLRIIAVGSVIPRKAYDVLVRAMAELTDLDWTLSIIGATAHAPDTVAEVETLIQALHLQNRIHLTGPMTTAQLDAAYGGADLFVMSSLYEGYGMVIAEAMARGLPIVATTGGAAAETLHPQAGLKVPPGMSQPLAKAIREMLATPSLRYSFSDGSWQAGQRLPGWDDTARSIARVIERAVR